MVHVPLVPSVQTAEPSLFTTIVRIVLALAEFLYRLVGTFLGYQYETIGFVLFLFVLGVIVTFFWIRVGLLLIERRQSLMNAVVNVLLPPDQREPDIVGSVIAPVGIILLLHAARVALQTQTPAVSIPPTFSEVISLFPTLRFAQQLQVLFAFLMFVLGYYVADSVVKMLVWRWIVLRRKSEFSKLEAYLAEDLLQQVRTMQEKIHEEEESLQRISSIGIDMEGHLATIQRLQKILHDAEKEIEKREYERTKEKLNEVKEKMMRLEEDVRDIKILYKTHCTLIDRLANVELRLRKNKDRAQSLGITRIVEAAQSYTALVPDAIDVVRKSYAKGNFAEGLRLLEKTVQQGETLVQEQEGQISEKEKANTETILCPSCHARLLVRDGVCSRCHTSLRTFIASTVENMVKEIEKLEEKLDAEQMKTEKEIAENLAVMTKGLLQEEDLRTAAMKTSEVGEKFLEFKNRVEKALSAKAKLNREREALLHTLSEINDIKKKLNEPPVTEHEVFLTELAELERLQRYEEALQRMKVERQRWQEALLSLQKKVEEGGRLREKIDEVKQEIMITKSVLAQAKNLDVNTENYDKHVDEIEQRIYAGMTIKEALEAIATLRKIAEDVALEIRTQTKVKEREKQLMEKVQLLRDKIAQCKVHELDASQEEQMLDDLLLQERNTTERIERIESMVEHTLMNIDEKLSLVDKWQTWEKLMQNVLEYKGKVTAEDLSAIPEKWRMWAMHRFVLAHAREGIILESGQIFKLQPKTFNIEQIRAAVATLSGVEGIETIVVARRDGIVIYSSRPRAEVVAAIAGRMVSTSTMVSEELGQGRLKAVVLYTRDKGMVIRITSNMMLACIFDRKVIDPGVVLEHTKALVNNLL